MVAWVCRPRADESPMSKMCSWMIVEIVSASVDVPAVIIARVAGLTAEVAEEHGREKPMRIRIPVEYDGVPPVAD